MDKEFLTGLLELLKYVIPSIVTFLLAYFFIKIMMEDNQNARSYDLRKETSKTISPLKMQAYERLVLMLERISPQQLFRDVETGASATSFKKNLLDTIHREFTYNVSQQLYVSTQAWTIISISKEQTANLIIAEYNRLPENAIGADLAKAVVDALVQLGEIPSAKAINFLKHEYNLMF